MRFEDRSERRGLDLQAGDVGRAEVDRDALRLLAGECDVAHTRHALQRRDDGLLERIAERLLVAAGAGAQCHGRQVARTAGRDADLRVRGEARLQRLGRAADGAQRLLVVFAEGPLDEHLRVAARCRRGHARHAGNRSHRLFERLGHAARHLLGCQALRLCGDERHRSLQRGHQLLLEGTHRYQAEDDDGERREREDQAVLETAACEERHGAMRCFRLGRCGRPRSTRATRKPPVVTRPSSL